MGYNEIIFLPALFLIHLIPQWRRINLREQDEHIGIGCAERLAGKSLGRILLSQPGHGGSFCLLGVQYDLFHGNIDSIKKFNIILNSFLPILLFGFVYNLIPSFRIAITASLLYSLSFNFRAPINSLVQPEHYELIFFLLGVNLALTGLKMGYLWAGAAGAFLMGISLMIKLPGLISFWGMYLLWKFFEGRQEALFYDKCMLFVFLLPFLISVVLYKIFPVRTSSGKIKQSLYERFKNLFLMHFRFQNKSFKEAFKSYVVSDLFNNLGVFLPYIILTLIFFKYAPADFSKQFAIGYIIVCFIFLSRLTFHYTFSAGILLSITAALGLPYLIKNIDEPMLILLVLSICSCCIANRVHISWFVSQSAPAIRKILEEIQKELLVRNVKDCGLLANCVKYAPVIHVMAEKALDYEIPHVPWIARKKTSDWYLEMHQDAGTKILDAFINHPPKVIVDSPLSVVNLTYLEEVSGTSYEPVKQIGQFILYERKKYIPVNNNPENRKIHRLFDVDQQKVRYCHSIKQLSSHV